MAELDELIDSLIQQRNAPQFLLSDEKYSGVLKIKQTTSKGDGIFAERFFSVQDTVCSLDYPMAMAIDSEFIPTTCYHCLVVTASPLPISGCGHVSIELKTCNGCHFARFCNRDCQVRAWSAYHKYECKVFKRLQGKPPPAILRAVMRVVLLKDRDVLPGEEWDRIVSLTSHEEILGAQGRSNLTEMAEGIKDATGSSMGINIIQKLIFILRSNAIEIPSPIYGGMGVMLDPLIAKLNHNCQPNLYIHRPQHTMISGWMDSASLSAEQRKAFIQVVPLRDIEEGEELFISYVVPTESVNNRRAKLRENYFFDCKCLLCMSDVQATTAFVDQNPNINAQFEQLTKNVSNHLSQVGHDPNALQKAAAALDNATRYLEYPVLYTSGDFPQMSLMLTLESLKAQKFDEALVCILRLYFLVNPQRFVGRHHPTNIYTIFLMLDVFDVVIGVTSLPGVTGKKVKKCLNSLSARGFSKSGLVYWRERICKDLRKRIEGSAAKDLLALVEKREAQVIHPVITNQVAKGGEAEKSAEREMSTALGLKEPRWMATVQENGC